MNEEKVLEYLGNLTNGALNYYKSSTEIMIMQSSIKDYINRLEQENQQLKEQLQTTVNNCKQRDEVIDEAIKYVLEHTIDMSVDGDRSDLMFEKANGYELLKILERYKGDNNEKI